MRRSKYDLENAHNSLNSDLATFLDARSGLTQPIFEAMAHAQNDYFSRSLTAWSNLLETFTQNDNLIQIDGDKCQQNLQHIKALSIVSDTKSN